MPQAADPTPRENLIEILAPIMNLPDRTAVAALNQMSWHLFCCYYLLRGLNNEIEDVIGEAADPEFLSAMTSGIAELRTSVDTAIADISVRHFDRLHCSAATGFQDELDGLSDPERILAEADLDPRCRRVAGKRVRACNRPVLYMGGWEWSEGCEIHACSADRDRHKQWRHSLSGTPGAEARLRQARQLTDVAKILLDWWPTVDSIDSVIRNALHESQA